METQKNPDDRLLRGERTAEEQGLAWRAEMEAGDEWLGGYSCGTYGTCPGYCFGLRREPRRGQAVGRKPVLYVPVNGRPKWHMLRITGSLDGLRKDIEDLLVRVGEDENKH